MVRIEIDQISEVINLIDTAINDHPLGARLDSAYVLAFLTMLTTSKAGAVFVDKIEDPTYALVCTCNSVGLSNERSCFVNVVYAIPDARNDKTTADMYTTLTAYANQERCEIIRGASPRFEGSESIDHFWEKFGAKPQEVVFIKKLK